jgi:hypothetical protein
MKRAIKITLLVILVGGLIFVGLSVYANIAGQKTNTNTKTAGDVEPPKLANAPYSVQIVNTGELFFTSNYETFGRTFILHGYFERTGKEFAYRSRDLILDQGVYGTITIQKRLK